MKVKDLIEVLQKCPQDLPIKVNDCWLSKLELSNTGDSGYEIRGEVRLIGGIE
tara:strand:+ start:1270 stop:1428 length:159 start_codon:yes stop_codon:yes gene_type:complete